MKTKTFMLALALGCSLASQAQWSNPQSLKTANNGTGLVAMGAADLYWEASVTSISSGYTTAIHQNNSSWAATPYSNCDWITYPHNCNVGDQTESWCPSGANVDEYYRITFSLGAAGSYAMTYTVMADNCVYEMFLNTTSGTPFYTTSVGSPYSYTGFYWASKIIGTITNANGLAPGTNTLYVHVKSSNASNSGNTGLLFYSSTSYSDTQDPPPSCCIGNICGNTSNPLLASYEIPLNGYDYNFSSPQASNEKVNVGYACATNDIGKFNVSTSAITNGGAGPESVSIFGRNTSSAVNSQAVGVMGDATNSSNGLSVGVWGTAAGSNDNIGGNFFAGKGTTHGYNVGVSGVAFPSTGTPPGYTYKLAYSYANIGVYGTGEPSNTDDNNTAGPNWAGWFDGDVMVRGKYWNNTTLITSDKRFKKDIKALDNISEKIQKLGSYTYNYRSDEFKERHFDNKPHIGFIAQEVKDVFPELVAEDSKGFYAVDYQGMIPVLLQAIKEQNSQIAGQQQQLNELKATLQALNGNGAGSNKTTSIPVNLSDKNMLVLNQNVPNPFAESTVISYNIPYDFSKAQIIFTTADGKVIKMVDITEKGANSLTVFANDLSHGVYTYQLVIDGKVIDSKKMIRQ